MDKTQKYLLNHFSSTFLSLFGTLFFVVTIIFFIQISNITAIIEVSFLELGKLYLFLLPEILLYTTPFSFFIALALMLFRLSKENETIVLFTLGYLPHKIALFFGVLSLFLSAFLLINSLVLMPLAYQLNKNFMDYKKNEAKINITPGQFGQKFSNWFVYASDKSESLNKKTYHNIVLYQMPDHKQNEHFIIANNATLDNQDGVLKFELNSGILYYITPKNMHISNFEKLIIKNQNNDEFRKIDSIINYWQDMFKDAKKARHFSLYTLISLFPLASFLFAISFGVVTYRYEKGEIYWLIFVLIAIYFGLSSVFSKSYPFVGIVFIFFTTFFSSILCFKIKILRKY